MGPQCEDGYTAIANELLEALCRIRIPGESMQIFLTILRKTYGFKKVADRISLSQFAVLTGLKKPNICRAIKQLQTLNVIQIDKAFIQNDNAVIQNDNACSATYRINKIYSTWVAEKRAPSRPKAVIQNDNASLSKTIINVIQNDTHKRKKETTTKERALLPVCESWKSYVEMRKKIKKPMTEKAANLAVMKLVALERAGHDPAVVLDQSVFNSWQGLFPPKAESATRTPPPVNEHKQTEADLRAKGLIE